MQIQSRTYNNGTILEYIYTIVPPKGKTYKQSVFVDVQTGEVVDPIPSRLILDMSSENTFKGVCCTKEIEECNGWITEDEACWITDGGLGWGV